jgi:hypothetical protein
VCWPAAFRLDTNYFAAGDPVRIDGGALSGIYTNSGLGISAGDDQPVPGALAGDCYITLSGISGTVPNGPYLGGGLQPGKIVARLWGSDIYRGSSIDVKAGAVSSIAQSFESGAVRCVITCDGSGRTQVYGSVVPTANNTVHFPLAPWVLDYKDHVDIAVFGGGASVSSWYPAYFYGAEVEVTARGYPLNIEDTDAW